MSIVVRWENDEQMTVIWDFCGRWDWAEFHDAQQQYNEMIEPLPHRVHIIADLRQINHAPERMLVEYPRTQHNWAENHGIMIAVGASQLVSRVAEVMLNMYPQLAKRLRFVETMEEAESLVVEHPK